jgi:hypothetical protein
LNTPTTRALHRSRETAVGEVDPRWKSWARDETLNNMRTPGAKAPRGFFPFLSPRPVNQIVAPISTKMEPNLKELRLSPMTESYLLALQYCVAVVSSDYAVVSSDYSPVMLNLVDPRQKKKDDCHLFVAVVLLQACCPLVQRR